MKLQNLLARLEKHHKKKIDLSLDRTFSLLKKLGNPHQKLKNINERRNLMSQNQKTIKSNIINVF